MTSPVPEGKALVDRTLDLLRFDSSNPPGHTEEIVTYVEDVLSDAGIETERVAADPAKPNLLARLPGRGDATLCYNGHLDTIPYDEDEWTHEPLGERVTADDERDEGERIYGRGATDMKGAVAAMIEVIRSFAGRDEPPPVTLLLALVSDEETGGDAGLSAISDRIDADACVIGETTCTAGRHALTVADRGSIWLTLEAEGEAAHGSRPALGENAIDRLYDAVETLRAEFGSMPLEIEAAVKPIIEESITYYAPTMGERAARDLFRYPSINLGTIEGGSAVNAVPESARAEIDIRLSPGVHTPMVMEEIRNCADTCEGVTITDVSFSIGTYEDPEGPFVDAVAKTAETVIGEDVFRRSATGGGDAKTLRNAGITTVEFGVGTDTAHAADEHTTTRALSANARVYAQLPRTFAERL